MKMVAKQELVAFINNIYQAVEESKLGKMMEIKDEKLVINNVPFQSFLVLLSALCPKSVEASGGMEVKEAAGGSVAGTLTI